MPCCNLSVPSTISLCYSSNSQFSLYAGRSICPKSWSLGVGISWLSVMSQYCWTHVLHVLLWLKVPIATTHNLPFAVCFGWTVLNRSKQTMMSKWLGWEKLTSLWSESQQRHHQWFIWVQDVIKTRHQLDLNETVTFKSGVRKLIYNVNTQVIWWNQLV